ncbi:MAG: FGGY family carbohydrate kinase [Pseudomonadota bacterium]
MSGDLVIGIDSSTSATKAIAFDRTGRAVAQGRAEIPLSNPHPGWFEQDPEDWWHAAVTALKAVTDAVDPARIAGLAVSQQRETFGLFDHEGRAVRPGMLWLDERAKAEMHAIAEELGAERLHEVSGKPMDITPALPLYRWVADHEPAVWEKFERAGDVHAFLTWKLGGDWASSWASADPSGLVDMKTRDWSEEILNVIGMDRAKLPTLHVSGTIMGTVSHDAAVLTGLRAGTSIMAGGGDGQCAGTGANTLDATSAYLNLGTALVSGVYSADYAADPAFRTMGAVAETGYIFESCLRTGTFLVDWVVTRMFGLDPKADPQVFAMLEHEAAASPIGANGLMVVPYWSGSMTPHWDAAARGLFAGLNASHTRGDLYRAVLEGMALDQAQATASAQAFTGTRVENYVAIGGGASSDFWCQIMADATGRRVDRSDVIEASALGAAMAAAKGAGWFETIPDAAAAMTGTITDRFEPDPERHARYAELLALYQDLWPLVSDWNRRLVAFAGAA